MANNSSLTNGYTFSTTGNNYVAEFSPRTADPNSLDVEQVISYFDGLGRPIQKNSRGTGGSGEDQISFNEYDAFGREAKQYLPFAQANMGGQVVAGAGYPQSLYYNNMNRPGNAYTETLFEASPLNRPIEQFAPGSSISVKLAYRSNLSGEAKMLGYDAVSKKITVSTYAPNTLFVSESTDENGNISKEYKDLEGKVICKDIAGLKTAYAYDDWGLLRAVIPPLANGLLSQTSFDAFTNELLFAYDYDTRGRMTQKKVPSAGIVTLEYNDRDLLIKSTDGNGNAIETIYDGLNRVFITKQGSTILTENFYDSYFFGISYDAATAYNQPTLSNAKGLLTGSAVLVLGTNYYIYNGIYYEANGRGVIQKTSYTNYDDRRIEQISNLLDFMGRVLATSQTFKGGTTQSKQSYDVGGRVKQICHRIGTNFAWDAIGNYNYNGIGELNNKILGCNAQTVDYTYDIRGRLKSLNDPANLVANKDLFGMNLSYDNIGNISSQNYAIASPKTTAPFVVENPVLYNYSYQYDRYSRLTISTLRQNGATYLELWGTDYDSNGNIKTLNRKLQGVNADVLTYTYKANSNQIDKIEDTGNTTFFENKNANSTDYSYDKNGNTIKDLNKGITNITYNYLNLPSQMLVNGKTMNYIYSAAGEKLRMEVVGGDKYEYFVGGIVYKNSNLDFIPTAEGRYNNIGYEFNLNDHLGNLRVSFSCLGGIIRTLQTNHQDPWGLNLPISSSPGAMYGVKANRFLFTGKETQAETGLIDFGARQYDATAPHWLGIDPLAEKNHIESGYVYVHNNPLKYIDPDGKDGILIVFPDYKISTPVGKVGGLGHAGVLLIDNKTGLTKYYEYGRYDDEGKGYARNVSVSNVKIGKDGKPTQTSLNKILGQISKKSGHGTRIEGAYVESDNFEAMNNYAAQKVKEKDDPKRKPYSLSSNNCGTFACDVLNQDPNVNGKSPSIGDPRPNSIIEEYQGTYGKVEYNPKTGGSVETVDKSRYQEVLDKMKKHFNQ